MGDNKFWHNCKDSVNALFLWLFIMFAVLLAIDLWSLLITAIVYHIECSIKTATLLKILGSFGVIFILFSNFALWIAMDSEKIYHRLLSIVWSKKLRLLIILSLGYVNVYLLNLYYVKSKYTLYELTQYRVNVGYSALVMFPIVNIIVYISALRHSECRLSFVEAAKLYLHGKLATYLIQSDYSNLIQEDS